MDMSEIKLTHGLRALRGEMRMNESMKKYTSWRAGGEAERIYMPADLADLAQFIRGLPEDEPVYMVGLGSNLLVRDGGVRGTVVVLHARLNDLRLEQRDEHDELIVAGAGVACAKVARFAALHSLAGAEFLAGIPGTVGGALAMNAGCYGAETWGIVERVQILSRTGQLRERVPGDYEIGYRHVILKPETKIEDRKGQDASGEEWFVGGGFRLLCGEDAASRKKIKELLTRRINTQPLNLPNAGSVFRNPPGDHAARLIESCGLKGFRAGGAMVSSKHANFIVNTGDATAAEIEAVIAAVRETVKEQTGIELVQEVRIIGSHESGRIQNFATDNLIGND
ncbi:UDP-N-acetylmuramate dehydrogenase [Nitrosospira sp. Nsp5]|uniref:UDP-N-acetylenolpyruvoylglucosamine reductase n=1 Tax=Nitrosospira multiformis TaxID=1231 RepID=A0ABY0T5U5_9PROT|nr:MULTISPECIES: UDP-N-acetylmuramate dehydrogenase [Nitrosospira]PTR09515.1 UDP-N-acetylmuramate dehydrogenase [Nitrosospira sp. Nsp5]SDQ28303.1 UDP-N-acetylmuramate dehydrogenase [Nitrosospira multiformis]